MRIKDYNIGYNLNFTICSVSGPVPGSLVLTVQRKVYAKMFKSKTIYFKNVSQTNLSINCEGGKSYVFLLTLASILVK